MLSLLLLLLIPEKMRVPMPNAEIPNDYIKTGPPPLRHNSSWIWRWMTRMEKPNGDGTDPIFYKCRIMGCNWGMKKTVCCSPIKAETHLKLAHRLTQSVLASNLALTPLDNTMIHNYNNTLNLPSEAPMTVIPNHSNMIMNNAAMPPPQEMPPNPANIPGLSYGSGMLLPPHFQQGNYIPNHQFYQPYAMYQPPPAYESQQPMYQPIAHSSEQQYQSQSSYIPLQPYPYYQSQLPPNSSYKSDTVLPKELKVEQSPKLDDEVTKIDEVNSKKTEVQLWLEDCGLGEFVDFFKENETDFLSDLRCYSNLDSDQIAKKLKLNEIMKEADICKFYEELLRLADEKVEEYRIKVSNQRNKKRRLDHHV